eukprot:UN28731
MLLFRIRIVDNYVRMWRTHPKKRTKKIDMFYGLDVVQIMINPTRILTAI